MCYNKIVFLRGKGIMVIKKQVKPGSMFIFNITAPVHSMRLDIFLSQEFTRYSRSFFKRLIDEGDVSVNSQHVKAGFLLPEGAVVKITFPRLPDPKELKAFDTEVGVKIVAQHEDFVIVYKPAGLMVHKPNDFCTDITLVDWLMASFPELSCVGVKNRPGIVHRLDKDTSGLLIIPRNNAAHAIFGDMFRTRQIQKTYWALVHGHTPKSGSVNFPIGRHPIHKHRMVHLPGRGNARTALTQYQALAYYDDYTLLKVNIVTGRTHQIRVHCTAIGHPVLGDTVYGAPSNLIARQALHAKTLAFTYQEIPYTFDWPVPEDMNKLIKRPTILSAIQPDPQNLPDSL